MLFRSYPDRYQVVRYESLVAHPRETLSMICPFLGEEFLPSMLTLENAVRFGEDTSETAQTPDTVGSDAVSKQVAAAPVPSAREIAFMEARSGWAMISHNYQLRRTRCSPWDRFLLLVLEIPAGSLRTLAWRLSSFLQPDAAPRLRAPCGYAHKAVAAN